MPQMQKGAAKMAKNTNTITTKIVAEFKDRQRAEIKKWRTSLDMAMHPETPKRYMLQDLLDNLRSDGHYIGDMRVRRAATLCAPFSIYNKDTGDIDQVKTEFFQRKWFFDVMLNALDYVPMGYTLLELVDPAAPRFALVKRRNVVPQSQTIVLNAQDDKGIYYAPFIGRTLVEIGEADDLGLMADIAGQLIWKRNAQQSWAEFSERFGFPLITATTNKSSDRDIANIRQMLAALGEAAQAVLPEGTTIDIKASATGDAYMVYDKQIERINAEISKALLSGTMVTDNGSSRSQSEVHERTLDNKVSEQDRRVITFTVNDQIIPMLALWGHDFDPEVDRFRFEPSDELGLADLWTMLDGITNKYEVPIEWLSKKLGVPIIAIKQREAQSAPRPKAIESKKAEAKGITANFR